MGHLRKHGAAPQRRVLKLAPGVRLSAEREAAAAMLWVMPQGKVPLNEHARAILELCDGSRSLDRVVTDAVQSSAGGMRAADVVEFLDAARSRLWVIETL